VAEDYLEILAEFVDPRNRAAWTVPLFVGVIESIACENTAIAHFPRASLWPWVGERSLAERMLRVDPAGS
jgi:hypothetical protein